MGCHAILRTFQNEYSDLQAEGHPLAVQIEAGFRPCPLIQLLMT